jgi:hypothetical protein
MLTTQTHISGGKLIIDNRGRFAAEVAKLKDGIYELTLKKKARRSNLQNNYLWGVVYVELRYAMNNLGNDFSLEDIHEFCKNNFNKKELANGEGEVIGYIGGSTIMSKEDFSIYLDKIFLFANEYLGITIPLPDTELKLIF